MTAVPADLISRARAGDGNAFRELTEPHRRATDARRSASRRPAREWDVPNAEPPEPTRLGEVECGCQPFPDALLDGAPDVPLGPEARYEQTESISLAFVTALQVLPASPARGPHLRDVLGFHANEVADMLDSRSIRSTAPSNEPAPACSTDNCERRPRTASRLRLTMRGCDRGEIRQRMGVRRSRRTGRPPDRRRLHVDATDAVQYEGRDVVARFCASIFRAGRRFDLVPTRANGQPAFGAYLRDPTA